MSKFCRKAQLNREQSKQLLLSASLDIDMNLNLVQASLHFYYDIWEDSMIHSKEGLTNDNFVAMEIEKIKTKGLELDLKASKQTVNILATFAKALHETRSVIDSKVNN